ncbi:MAG: hypothetical protein HC884_09210 [Chloroflexaceae bacterium]|nr:hypothetical protein [Chloroflexaceae bacterium]
MMDVNINIGAFLWRATGLMMIFAFVVGQYALLTLPRIERGTTFWQVVAIFWATYRQTWQKVLPHPLFWGGAGLYWFLTPRWRCFSVRRRAPGRVGGAQGCEAEKPGHHPCDRGPGNLPRGSRPAGGCALCPCGNLGGRA